MVFLTLLAAALTGVIATSMQTAEGKGQCKEDNDGDSINCSGGIGTPPGGRGGHQEFQFDGDTIISGGNGEPGQNQEIRNGRHCDSERQGCVGDGFNSGSGDD